MTDTIKCFAGFDPGKSGAFAFYFRAAPEMIAAEDFPLVNGEIDSATLADRLRQMRPDFAIIERVGAMPKQGVSSTFNFGKSYGVLLGVVAALQIPSALVTPGTWKKAFKLSADKEEARALALRQWPARAELFARKKDHGRAEAALLALWGARHGGPDA
jgi:crossover junction endodeoxyribonuclease RuvC